MLGRTIISVDIGSTYTKAALFKKQEEFFELLDTSVLPTTTDYLPGGFYSVLAKIYPKHDWQSEQDVPIPIYFSSSAKGGLKIDVVGLVPELTMQIARLAAYSAGAKISSAFSYKLTNKSLEAIKSNNPDIVLLSGGTNGGNEHYILENAKKLANLDVASAIIFAGNEAVIDEIKDILSHKQLYITENLMPDFGKLNIEPVRSQIRDIFLDQIILGKGLDEITKKIKTKPLPTPLSVFNLVKAIGESLPDWQNFALVDMGGATTDFYSYGEAFFPENNTFLKGIHEPKLKRTVEGDLGMRVTALSAFEEGFDCFKTQLTDAELDTFKAFSSSVANNIEYIPHLPQELLFDELLAKANINNALVRHAGTIEEVFTIQGPVWAQTGKDLRKIDKLIGTGGYLAAMGRQNKKMVFPDKSYLPKDKISLTPQNLKYYADTRYLLPLLGNLAEEFPDLSAMSVKKYVSKLQE